MLIFKANRSAPDKRTAQHYITDHPYPHHLVFAIAKFLLLIFKVDRASPIWQENAIPS